VLFVCTANVNRSPMAAALLVHHLAEARIPALIASAGLLEGGRPASSESVAVLKARGIDLSRHRSRRISPQLVAEADLILGMERRHVRAAVMLDADAATRSFALKDLIRRALERGGRRPDRPLSEWLDELDDGRSSERIAGDVRVDEVEDPLGRGPEAFESCASELDLLARGLRHLVWDDGQTPR